MPSSDYLIWIDLEMTGLKPDTDVIIEMATIVTDANLDVSTLKELARRWAPELIPGFSKRGEHMALADIQESIRELAYYREHFLAPEYAKL